MKPKLYTSNRHTRPAFLLWFLTITFLVWQVVITKWTNKHYFRSRPPNLRVQAQRKDLLDKNRQILREDAAYSFTPVITSGQSNRVNFENNSMVSSAIRISKTKTRNDLILNNIPFIPTEVKIPVKVDLSNLEKSTISKKESIISNNDVFISNDVDNTILTRNDIFKRNISILSQMDGSSAIQCKNIRFPVESLQKEKMQWVESVDSTLVYSAYHDVEKPNFVQIVAICYRDTTLPYFCQVWYKETESGAMAMFITNATFVFTNRSSRKYKCCYIICSLPSNLTPSAVSIVQHSKCLPANNLLEVTLIERKLYTRNFTMCLSALHSNFDDTAGLVEWIEFNKILGANHFVIYNFSSGQNIQKVLKYYIKKGLIEVLQWPLPSILDGKHRIPKIIVHYFAQSSAYNDCLHRSKSYSKYVVVTDIDEFLVPHIKGAKTWLDMFKHLPDADAFYFRNCFFPLTHTYNNIRYAEKETAKNLSIVSLLALQRLKDVSEIGTQTKYITRTIASYFLRTHRQRGARAVQVDPSVGLLHHYRRYGVRNETMVIDTRVLDVYVNDLLTEVMSAWNGIRRYTKFSSK